MFPFLMPADAMRLSIRIAFASAEANRALWVAAVQAGTWWMRKDSQSEQGLPCVQPAPDVGAPERQVRKRAARR